MPGKTKLRRAAGSAVLAALLLTGCSNRNQTPQPTPVPTPTADAEIASPVTEAPVSPSPAVSAAPSGTPGPSAALTQSLEAVRTMIAEGRCYAAFQELLALEDSCRSDPAGMEACERLFDELDTHLREIEPVSGTELARSFTIQGGCVLEVHAFNGPALVAVSDAMAEPGTVPNSVRFYVRQGERGSIQLPAGTYYVGYQVGYRWFGETDGFGEYYTEGTLPEPLEFDFYMDGQWASNAKFTITL